MPIVSSVIAEDAAQSDGRRRITEVHTDHLGVEHRVSYLAESGADVEAAMEARKSEIEAQMADSEDDTLLCRFEERRDDVTAYAFAWSTRQRFARKLIRYVMASKDVKLVLALRPLITWLKVTYTANQIASYFGVTTAQLGRINTRLDAIFALSDTLIADDGRVEEI